jgi:hypothetical protein
MSERIRHGMDDHLGSAVHHTQKLDIICGSLSSVPEIQYLYVKEKLNSVSVLAIVPNKDFAVERTIYDMQPEIIDACPGIRFNLRVISLRGRKLSNIAMPAGKLVFQRGQ